MRNLVMFRRLFGDKGGIYNLRVRDTEVILKIRALRSLVTALVLLAGAGMTMRAARAIELFRFNVQGNYALSWYGADYSASPRKSAFALVGILSFDGKMSITAGSINYNDAGVYCEGGIAQPGKYNILPDGQGWFIFDIVLTSGTCPITHFEFPVAITNVGGSKLARRISFGAGGGLPATLTGSGLAVLQGGNPMTLSDESLHNGFSFSWFGHDFLTTTSGSNGFGAVGEIDFRKGKITSGSIAYNDGGMICSAGLSGGYTVGADGGAVINLKLVGAAGNCPLTEFAMTAALSEIGSSGSAQTIQFLSASARAPGSTGSRKVVVSGTAVKVGKFTVPNLQGIYSLGWYGADYSAPVHKSSFALGGLLSLDGNGAITAGSISYNDAGAYCEGVIAHGANYNVMSDGEGAFDFDIVHKSGTCPITHFEFPIAIADVKDKVAQRVSMGAGGGLPANLTGSGLAVLQARKPVTPSNASLDNGYSFSWFGSDFATTTSPDNGFGAVGEVGFRKGKILGGSIAYNDGGMICRAGGQSGEAGLSGAGLSGSYTVGADGVAVINLEVVGTTGSCPLTSFVLRAALSDIRSSGSAQTIQFLSASAAGSGSAGSHHVVVSGTALKVGRFVLNQ
jgi:hypothetical protein